MAPVRGDEADTRHYFYGRQAALRDKCGISAYDDDFVDEQKALGKSGVLRIVRAEIKRREKARQC